MPGIPLHIIQRGNNRSVCFFGDDDYRLYLDWLLQYAAQAKCRIHAYVLMTNHVHLLLTADEAMGAGALMKALGQRYVQHINRSHGRSGTLWEGRFRSCLIQDDAYLLACMRYIELNPVRAGMVAQPRDYRWSSYPGNAQGKPDALLNPHELYLALGPDATKRRAAYRKLFREKNDPGAVDAIRKATNGNFALGNVRFAAEIERALGRRVLPGVSGRPKKLPEPATGDLLE